MDKFDRTHWLLIAGVAGAFLLGLMVGRRAPAAPAAPVAASNPGADSQPVTFIYEGMPYPSDLSFNINGDFPGIASLSNEYFPLFGFVGYKAF